MWVSSSSKAWASSSEAKEPPWGPHVAIVPATRPIICLTDDSRSGESMRPRKYFWATMFVEFCDQDFGNSTPRCSNAGFSGSPMTASRISHSIASNGLTPGSVKRLPTLTPSPAAVMAGAVALRLSGMTSPRVSDSSWRPQGGKTDIALRPGRTGIAFERQLIRSRKRVFLVAADDGLELVEVAEVAVHGRELDRGDRVEHGEGALREVADLAGLDLRTAPPHRRRDRLRQLHQLLRTHGPLVGGPLEPSQELLAVESLATAVALENRDVGLSALVCGEAVAAVAAFATAADGIAGFPGVDHRGRFRSAVGAMHTPNSTRCSARILPEPLHIVPS